MSYNSNFLLTGQLYAFIFLNTCYSTIALQVHYEAGPYKGYVAKVSYEGQAKHPKTYGAPVTFFNKGHGHGHGQGHGHGHGGYH